MGTSNTTAEFGIFSTLVVLIGAVVLGGIVLDIYLHPADPLEVGTATVEISGTAPFRGEVGIAGGPSPSRAERPSASRFPSPVRTTLLRRWRSLQLR